MKKCLLAIVIAIAFSTNMNAQACTPAGDQTTPGTNDTWIGYIYDNIGFTSYSGYVNEGIPGNPNFDESFGGDYVNYPTNGCPVLTETFSARYMLTKTFTAGAYQFTVGADDGYRLSIDGGATWIINHFNDQSYTFSAYAISLSGTYNLVLEYYENGGGNRVSFAVASTCAPISDQSIYGTGNIWNGYIYKGTNFDMYSGMVTEGAATNPNFDENFGGDNTLYATDACLVQTENFSARYRLQKTFVNGNYTLTIGGDDGYRFSMDGGATWVINRWFDQGYNTSTYTAPLAGTYNMVLEYYENGGGNEVSFASTLNNLLPVQLLNFSGKASTTDVSLSWRVTKEINTGYYLVERSINGIDFSALGKVSASTATFDAADKTYRYTDPSPAGGLNYYRLRMIDKDGQFSYSPVIKVLFQDRKEITLFPSVVDHTPVYLRTSAVIKNAVVELFDMTGKKQQEIKLPALVQAGETIALSLQHKPAGNYILICRAGADVKAKQVIMVQ